MIDTIIPFIKDDQIRAFAPYQTFLKDQVQFIKHKEHDIYESFGHESNCVKLLRYTS